MILCPLILSSTDSDYDETLASMQCGNRAKLIENAAKRNEVVLTVWVSVVFSCVQ